MALGAFDDKASPPDDRRLGEVLGPAYVWWMQLTREFGLKHGPLVEEWNFAGKAFGWSFRLKQPKRVFVYLLPCRGHFLASFVLGDKACKAAHAGGLPASVLTLIDEAPKYAEGKGVRIPVRTAKDTESVRRLAAIKFAS